MKGGPCVMRACALSISVNVSGLCVECVCVLCVCGVCESIYLETLALKVVPCMCRFH